MSKSRKFLVVLLFPVALLYVLVALPFLMLKVKLDEIERYWHDTV
jgi:hypothetical protein